MYDKLKIKVPRRIDILINCLGLKGLKRCTVAHCHGGMLLHKTSDMCMGTTDTNNSLAPHNFNLRRPNESFQFIIIISFSFKSQINASDEWPSHVCHCWGFIEL